MSNAESFMKAWHTKKIVKLTDAEIVTASLEKARRVFSVIEELKFDSLKIDSVEKKYHVKIGFLKPGAKNALDIENQLIEAYVLGAETGSTQDNIQKLRTGSNGELYDSLLYSRPVLKPLADGAVNVEGIWSIYLSKKDVILSLSE